MSKSTASWQARGLAAATPPVNSSGWVVTSGGDQIGFPAGVAIPILAGWENNTGGAATTASLSYSTFAGLTISPNPENINGGGVVPDASAGFGNATMTGAPGGGSGQITIIFNGLDSGGSLISSQTTMNVSWT